MLGMEAYLAMLLQGLLIFSLLICWTLFACAAYDYLRQQWLALHHLEQAVAPNANPVQNPDPAQPPAALQPPMPPPPDFGTLHLPAGHADHVIVEAAERFRRGRGGEHAGETAASSGDEWEDAGEALPQDEEPWPADDSNPSSSASSSSPVGSAGPGPSLPCATAWHPLAHRSSDDGGATREGTCARASSVPSWLMPRGMPEGRRGVAEGARGGELRAPWTDPLRRPMSPERWQRWADGLSARAASPAAESSENCVGGRAGAPGPAPPALNRVRRRFRVRPSDVVPAGDPPAAPLLFAARPAAATAGPRTDGLGGGPPGVALPRAPLQDDFGEDQRRGGARALLEQPNEERPNGEPAAPAGPPAVVGRMGLRQRLGMRPRQNLVCSDALAGTLRHWLHA